MYRPVGGRKRRAWRLKKKHDKWFLILAENIFRETLRVIKTGSHTLQNAAYTKYTLFNRFWKVGEKR